MSANRAIRSELRRAEVLATRETDLEEANAISDQPKLGLIPIHFDVPGNYLPLATFVDTANQVRAVVEAFSRELFAGELEFEFYVLPPEKGSFKTRFALVVLAGIGTFVEIRHGQGAYQGAYRP